MILGEIVLGAPEWTGWAVAAIVIGSLAIATSYLRSGYPVGVRLLSAALKWVGLFAIAVCLIEPLYHGTRPRPGSNLFVVVADNSRSMELSDGRSQSRGQIMRDHLSTNADWLTRLGQDFEVRRYSFDSSLHPVTDFSQIKLDGQSSALVGALASLGERLRGQPVAGILVLTDGNATDLESIPVDWSRLPAVYPVAMGNESKATDVSVSRVSITQTNFEAAPVTITAELSGQGVADKKVVVQVLDESGKEVERRTVAAIDPNGVNAQRFLLRPEKAGVSFFTVRAALEGEEKLWDHPEKSTEATLANNRRFATVDRGGGPYRVLYVSGRPNWEFKFLRRALSEDPEVKLSAMVRIAKREPKFSFLSHRGERTNPLFRGFGNQADEQAEQYDQPVLVRIGEDAEELRGGFPKSSEDLFRYHALIVDDMESGFFTQEQMSLMLQFVSKRGGGFMMLGGKDSFTGGAYQRTPVAEMLPVYLDRTSDAPPAESYRLKLTREGWLQPFLRLRTNEPDEEKRIAEMPGFMALNRIDAIKPGASVLAQVELPDGAVKPGLVSQPFGRGRAAAMLVGDLWRWELRRPDPATSDLQKAWRQTLRWLVSDVPKSVEVDIRPANTDAKWKETANGVDIVVQVRDKQFEPLDNATVKLHVHTPDNRTIDLDADTSESGPGQYVASFVPREPGPYRVSAKVQAPDGTEVGEREAGWAVEPETEEFRTLTMNRPFLEKIARETNGEVLSPDDLGAFVSSLPNRKIPIVEEWTYPLWHRWHLFLFAISCLVCEWGLRRWKGMP